MSEEVKSVLVRDWYIQIYPEGMLVILGTKMKDEDGVIWRSSPIMKRVSSRVVETLKGSRYVLQGDINRLMTRQDPKAYPVDGKLLEVFSRGFPVKWHREVEQFCTRKEAEKRESKRSAATSGSDSATATETMDTEVKGSSRGKRGKSSNVRSKGKRLKSSPMATRSSKSKQSTVINFTSGSSSGEASGLVNTLSSTSDSNSVRERSMTPVDVDISGVASESSTPATAHASESDSSRHAYGLRPRGRVAVAGAMETDSDSTEMVIKVNSTDTSGKEEGAGSAESRPSASARTRGILKHRGHGNSDRTSSQDESSIPAEVSDDVNSTQVAVLDSSTYFTDVLSDLKRSFSGRLIKTPRANIHYECDMKGNFIGLSPQMLTPKFELGNADSKKKMAKGKKKKMPSVHKKSKEEDVAVEKLETPSIKSRKPKGSVGGKPKALLQKGTEKDPVNKTKKKNKKLSQNKETNANQLLHNLRIGQMTKESTEDTSDSSSNPTLILAKRGTLKRSRQIQEAMRERDAGYSADAFDEATPLKKKAKVQFQDLDEVSEDDDYDSDSNEENVCEIGYESPVTMWRERLGAPMSTTPDLSVYDYDEPTTIRSADRKAAAQISYRIRKKPLRVKGTKTDAHSKGKTMNSTVVIKNLQAATRKMDTLVDADSDDSFANSEFSDSSSECEDVLNSL